MGRRAHIDRRAEAIFRADIWNANEPALTLRIRVAIALPVRTRRCVRAEIRSAVHFCWQRNRARFATHINAAVDIALAVVANAIFAMWFYANVDRGIPTKRGSNIRHANEAGLALRVVIAIAFTSRAEIVRIVAVVRIAICRARFALHQRRRSRTNRFVVRKRIRVHGTAAQQNRECQEIPFHARLKSIDPGCIALEGCDR